MQLFLFILTEALQYFISSRAATTDHLLFFIIIVSFLVD